MMKEKTNLGVKVLTAVVLIVIFFIAYSESEPPITLEYKLAVINAGTHLPKTHPSIEKFRKLLISIKSKCKNNRDQISDISVAAWKDLNENEKIKISLIELMNELDKSIPKETVQLKNGLNFAEVAAAYITLRVSNNK